jgi:hypothetical protein
MKKSFDSYELDLALAWTARVVLATCLIAFLALSVGCAHNLDLSSKGSLSREGPPAANTVAN